MFLPRIQREHATSSDHLAALQVQQQRKVEMDSAPAEQRAKIGLTLASRLRAFCGRSEMGGEERDIWAG